MQIYISLVPFSTPTLVENSVGAGFMSSTLPKQQEPARMWPVGNTTKTFLVLTNQACFWCEVFTSIYLEKFHSPFVLNSVDFNDYI